MVPLLVSERKPKDIAGQISDCTVYPHQLPISKHRGEQDLIRSRTQTWVLCAFASATALLLIVPVWRATLRVGLGYNEGWNALLAARLMSGAPLYPPFDALSANNYPPLSFYAAGWLGRWLGDYLFAGRVLAFIGLFTSAVAIAASVMRLTGRAYAAVLSGILLLGASAALYPDYIGIDDPQWLGHAIMLLGLLAFLASEQRGWLFIFSAGLILTAGFVKHLLLPIPLAATLWLLLYRRETLALWLTTCALLLASALALCFAAYGPNFFQGVFHDPRSWSLSLAYSNSRHWFKQALPLILLGALALPSVWRREQGRLFVYYGAISATLAIFALGGAGVDMNAMFDLEIALCVIIGLAIGASDEDDRSFPIEASSAQASGSSATWGGLLLLLGFVLGLLLPSRLSEVHQLWRGSERPREAETAAVVDFMTKLPGPVACENLSLCYWAGKGFEIDFFETGQKLERGFIEPHVVIDRLRSHYYAAIQTFAKDGASLRLPEVINSEIARDYEVMRTGAEGAVLVPRRQ